MIKKSLVLRLIHTGNVFKQEASDFLLASMDTGIFYSTFQIVLFSIF